MTRGVIVPRRGVCEAPGAATRPPPMPIATRQPLLCLLNVTVLLVHQIDAAYWHEWELFRIPGATR